MQIVKGHFPESKDFHIDHSWHKLTQPESRLANLKAIPMSLLLSLITIGFGIPFFQITITWPEMILGMIFGIFIVVPIHQFMHATSYTEDPRSDRVMFGYDLKSRIVYAYYDGKMSRKNMITSLIAPFIVLSIIPTMVMYTFHRYMNIVMVMMIVNSLISGIDGMVLFKVLKEVPKDHELRQKGYDIYHRPKLMKDR